ncbi:MAG TPA: nuclear transport factor 2 family protein [Alphaproteobacteria bacterium]|nr:nuclear transport factor 2 family protein [Alphaproteobacteria bacterium]
MPTSEKLQWLLDREEIFDLVRSERFARDQGEFDRLAALYTPDSRVRVSWFTGTGKAFADASRAVLASGLISKHLVVPMKVEISGNRALVESYGQVQSRDTVGGALTDLVAHCRFYSRVRRTAQGWRLASFDCIYQRDELKAVNPAQALPIDWTRLAELRPSYCFLIAIAEARGYRIDHELPGDDRPDLVAALYREGAAWLSTDEIGPE